MPRRRLLTFTLWTGTLLCVLIAAAFVVSGWFWVAVQVPTNYGPAIAVTEGLFVVVLDDHWVALVVADVADPYDKWVAFRNSRRWGWSLWNKWDAGSEYLNAPLYALFVTVAIPTLAVWRFWPKPVKPGHCRCGYDLRGNTSGTCPECGVEAQA